MQKHRSFFTVVVLPLILLTPLVSSADLITFNSDAPGIYPNPFVSVESAHVSFSEVGAGAVGSLGVGIFGSPTNILNSSTGSGGADEILMEFDDLVTSLSFYIGHPGGFPGDGWLRVFDESNSLVADIRVALDTDFLLNQVISYSGTGIRSARYAQVVTGSILLGTGAEVIDNVEFTIVPVPGAFLLGMLGLSVAGVKLRKHS